MLWICRTVRHIPASALHNAWTYYAEKHLPAAKFHVMTTGVATSVSLMLKPRLIPVCRMSSDLRFNPVCFIRTYPLLSPHADRHALDMLFTVCNFVCSQIFCNGYLRRGLTQSDEMWENDRSQWVAGHLPFW